MSSLRGLYQLENPIARSQGLSGSAANKFAIAIQGKQNDAQLKPPPKTVGGGILNAAGGAQAGLSAVSALKGVGALGGTAAGGQTGSAAGPWGAAIGAALGALAYYLS